MESLRPNDTRGKNAVMLLWIMLALTGVRIMSSYLQYDLLQAIAAGGDVSDEATTSNDIREALVNLLFLVAQIVCIVTFILWFRRAYFNLHLFVKHLAHEESAAAISWFIPFVNLVRPYQIMKELYVETRELLQKQNPISRIELSTLLVGTWWTFWVIAGIVGGVISRLTWNADTVDELLDSTMADLMLGLFDLPLTLLAIYVVKSYTNAEAALATVQLPGDSAAITPATPV